MHREELSPEEFLKEMAQFKVDIEERFGATGTGRPVDHVRMGRRWTTVEKMDV